LVECPFGDLWEVGHEQASGSDRIVPYSRCHYERQACPGKGDHFLGQLQHTGVIRDVAVDVTTRGEVEQNTPVIRLINKLWGDILEAAEPKVRWPIEAVDNLIRKVVVRYEM
jgi:hypothetical protein